jgi:hypothetical protein
MSATTHPFAPEEIMAHLDGELLPAQSQSVSAHIKSCAACQELVTSLRSTSSSLSSWTVSSAPTASETNQLSAARDAASAQSYSSDRILHPRPRRHWRLLTASALLAVLLIMATTSHMSKLSPASPPPAREREATLSNLHAEIALQQKQEASARASNSLPVDLARINSLGEKEYADTKMYTLNGPMVAPSTPPPSDSPRARNGYKAWLAGKDKNRLPASGLTPPAPMIARTLSLAIIAKDFDSSRAALDAILVRHDGYAADLNVATPQGAARFLQASLRIPAPQLAAALAELKTLGRVELENQNGEEVTQQHADLVARLKNSRETEQRLQAILTQRTGKISDVLEVEQEIARVRGEIEQMEAEQKNLEHRVDFATIDLKLSEEYKAKLDSPAPAISTLIHNSAVNGYRNVADTLLSIVLFFAEYGPVLAFWLLLFSIPMWLVWRRWRYATAAI